jgi:DNA-binding winged helix-turn-helix (wHTH) protein/predicted ATPase
MPETRTWSFAPFHLDLGAARLWQGTEPVRLTAKAFAVLCYLVEHAGQLVTKDDLFAAAWASVHVSEAALAVCIREIRRALGDTAQAPRYLETVRGRGYRFVAPVTVPSASPALAMTARSPLVAAAPPEPLIGREAALTALHQRWAQARQGVRQVVFVTGEAGIGKTTLVDAFVAQLAATALVWHGRGQCIEQHGAGEPYLPLLEALGRLGRGPDGGSLLALLHQQAPSWLVHLPALVPPETAATLQHRTGGTTRERMLRELAEAVAVLTVDQPLVLVLEDLHWSDGATMDWLAYVARWREATRLLVLGTYRPVDAIVRRHPVYMVAQELRLHGQATEVVLGSFSAPEVATYLARRFGTDVLPAALAGVLHQRTEGNPLFLVTVVDDLVQQGMVRQEPAGWTLVGELDAAVRGVPESLRQLMEQQLAQLPPAEQRLLEAASVAGTEFVTAAVAAGVDESVEAVEGRCAALARRGQFVQAHGVVDWPDGTVAARYGFRHALYREMLYERVPVSQRVRWHRQIGGRLETGYGVHAREMAVELAAHFVRGRDPARAVPYLQMAGGQAMQRSAHQAALQHFTQALELLATLPASPAHAQQEIALRIALGPALMAAKGWAAPEVEATYARARALCAQVGESPQLFPALMGLSRFYLTRGPLSTARELGHQLDKLAQAERTLPHRLEAQKALGDTLFFLGELAAARTHLEQGIALIDPLIERAQALRYGVAPGVRCLLVLANTLWCLGAPTQAVQRSQEALALAQVVAHPQSLAMTHHFAALLHYRRREALAVQTQAEALLTLATAQGFPLYVGHGTCWQGWTLAVQGQVEAGTAQLHRGLDAVLATGQTMTRPFHLILLAEAARHAGQVEVEQHRLAEALTACETSGRADLLAEVYRLQGEGLRHQAGTDPAQAVACLQQALTIARRQQAKSWELRAAMSLARLWQQQGKQAEARALLAPIYGWFTEGFDTADLQEAKALLEELGG